MMKIFAFGLILSLLNPIYAGEKDLLNLVKEGNIRSFSRESKYQRILNSPKEILDRFVARTKGRYSRFDVDLMYSFIARDEEKKYEIFFNIDNRKCVMNVNTHDVISKINTCDEKFRLCLFGKNLETTTDTEIAKCYQSIPECKIMSSVKKPKEISVLYCNKLYGRSL